MRKLNWWKTSCAVCILCAAIPNAGHAQTFTSLLSFNGTDGANPYYMSLVQGTDGNLYATTLQGGVIGEGTVFKLTPTGTLTRVYSFCSQGFPQCTDGLFPYGGLVLGASGNIYGTTYGGGASTSCFLGCGTIFKITPTGTLTTLHSFDSADGAYPTAALVQATNGNFYGTTNDGGADGYGTIFKSQPGAR